MKKILIALLASLAFSLPALQQSTSTPPHKKNWNLWKGSARSKHKQSLITAKKWWFQIY